MKLIYGKTDAIDAAAAAVAGDARLQNAYAGQREAPASLHKSPPRYRLKTTSSLLVTRRRPYTRCLRHFRNVKTRREFCQRRRGDIAADKGCRR